MRASTAVLTDTSVRLWDLEFPATERLVVRTRAAYVHLDNLIAYAKRDRDGKVDAYLVCYRPDELVLLFFAKGDLVNAALVSPAGTFPIPIAEALRHIAAEPERAEICYHRSEPEMLAAMFATIAHPPQDLGLSTASAEALFGNLLQRQWTGVLALIADGRVNYLRVREGRFAGGDFAEPKAGESPAATIARMFTATPPAPRPVVVARAHAALAALPHQAPPAMLLVFRTFVWDLTDAAERERPGDAMRRAERVRARLAGQYDVLRHVGGARGADIADPVVEPVHLAEAVAVWTREFLNELEIGLPGIAPRLLTQAGRPQRFALNALQFFDRLPWHPEW
jgi:hypothetical protein